jgi:shikimate dehydrogenase
MTADTTPDTTPDTPPGTTWCAVLGDPIEHSLSPVLHTAGYREVGLDWAYRAHRVDESGLRSFLADLDEHCRGLSLTMPLKRTALDLVGDATDIARTAGAANTVVVGPDGHLLADNTDVPGAAAALREKYDGPVEAATIWGGGATAASVLLALAGLGCRRFALRVRDPQRAGETLAVARRHADDLDVSVGTLGDPARGDVLVSTIPAEAQTEWLLESAAEVPLVFEVRYHPWPTPLAVAALDSSRRLVTGLDLLVHQAALQFELFTGHPAPLASMRVAGESALAGR